MRRGWRCVWLCFGLLACAQEPSGGAPDEAFVQMNATQRALADVLEAHAQADAAMALERWERARERLMPLVRPAALAELGDEERTRIQQDAYFRLAHLALRADQPALALDDAERGLALGDTDQPWVGNLHIVLGRAAEQLGRDERAAEAYHRALRIQEHLLDVELEKDSP